MKTYYSSTFFMLITGLCFFSLGIIGNLAQASVVISGTRVIYPENQKEVTVKINNMGTGPVVLQSWIDIGDSNAKPDSLKVPFILTPPINRVEPNKSQTLRISYTDGALPNDKESVFWLNVLEIPAKVSSGSNENFLQMAFRSRIKLFYRPVGLTSNPNDAVQALIWSRTPEGLKVSNPTPFHISLVTVGVNVGGKKYQTEGQMVSPKSNLDFTLSGLSANQRTEKVDFDYVNDYGAVNTLSQAIKP